MSFDIICFDCDSTLSAIEGIDELAMRAGCGAEMAELTNSAMNGEVSLESVYKRRLELIRPNQAEIDWLANRYIEARVQGVVEVFAHLQAQGKQLKIISGGLKQAILPLAKQLNVKESDVYAVEVLLDAQGDYLNFNEQSLLARNGGKALTCRLLNPNALRLAMIGDGNTDMEAKQAGAFCIGFGGVVSRDKVREQADVFVESQDLSAVLQYLS